MNEEIEITLAGVGTSDGCWIWHDGALHQINTNEGSQGEIHSLHMKCHKGDWSLVPETSRNPILWNTLALRLLEKIDPWQRVV